MVQHQLWRTEATRTLSAESHGFRLVVQMREETGGTARFLVLRPGTAEISEALIGSGDKDDVRAAMTEAELMAERCAALGLLGLRPPP